MDSPPDARTGLASSLRQTLHRLLAIGSNRFELLTLELQEERDRLLANLLVLLIVAGLILLALMAASAALVIALWSYAPVATLVALAVVYGLGATVLALLLSVRLRSGRPLAATREQLGKDRTVLAERFG